MRKKPVPLIITIAYLLCLILFRWGGKIDLGILFFLAGGILGIYFLDLADLISKISPFRGEPSPFRNVLFQSALAILGIFVLTSSGSVFGSGLVLTMFLMILLDQREELGQNGNLQNWFGVIKTEILLSTQKIYFAVMIGIFVFLSFLFV